MSFVIRKSAAGDGQNFLVLDLENLCANAVIAQALVRGKEVSGSLNVKVKTNRPYRVAYSARAEGAAYLREREDPKEDPVLTLSAGGKSDCDMYVSEVVGPNQYFERTFLFDSEAIKDGCLYVFTSADAEAPFEGTIVVNVEVGHAEPRFTEGRKRGRQPALQK